MGREIRWKLWASRESCVTLGLDPARGRGGNFFSGKDLPAYYGLPLSTDFDSLNAFKRSIFKTDLSEYLI